MVRQHKQPFIARRTISTQCTCAFRRLILSSYRCLLECVQSLAIQTGVVILRVAVKLSSQGRRAGWLAAEPAAKPAGFVTPGVGGMDPGTLRSALAAKGYRDLRNPQRRSPVDHKGSLVFNRVQASTLFDSMTRSRVWRCRFLVDIARVGGMRERVKSEAKRRDSE